MDYLTFNLKDDLVVGRIYDNKTKGIDSYNSILGRNIKKVNTDESYMIKFDNLDIISKFNYKCYLIENIGIWLDAIDNEGTELGLTYITGLYRG